MAKAPLESNDPRIARTRQHALEATLQLIAETGLQGCTFETIAERSGVARSTLCRHWNHKSDIVREALESQHVERVDPDTGNLRDDMLTAMLELGQALQHSTWGIMIAQLMAAAAIDPDVARVHEAASEYHTTFEAKIINRAIERREIPKGIDPTHAAMLFSAPIFYQHLFSRRATDAKWITAHIDKTMALLRTH